MSCSHTGFLYLMYNLEDPRDKLVRSKHKCIGRSSKNIQSDIITRVITYSRTPLFWTRLIRSPRYFKGRSNCLGFTLMFSVIYYQLFRTRLFRIPRYFELIVLSLHLKSTPLFRTCQKQSTYIRAQLETYYFLFEHEQNIQRFFNATASADLSDIEIPVFLFNLCLSSYSTVF